MFNLSETTLNIYIDINAFKQTNINTFQQMIEVFVCVFFPLHFCLHFRPDNWVMYDATHKTPLPRTPIINSEYEENSNEMPRPIIVHRGAQAG